MPKLALPPLVEEADPAHPVLGGGLGPYGYRILGEAGGLTQFGVHLEILAPGSRSSFRHWHRAEDEFVWLIAGTLILHDNAGETPMHPGDAAAWPAGVPDGHCLENRGPDEARYARYLVVGTRAARDVIHYPDHDLVTTRDGAARAYARADGTPRAPGGAA